MDVPIAICREGLIFCLLGSDRPIHESFAPCLIDQRAAMENQFDGMTDIPFTYEEFEQTRSKLMNIAKLSKLNPQKLTIEAKRLEKIFGI